MPIRFKCGACQQTVQFSSKLSGTIVTCPACKESIRVPGTPMPAVPTPPPESSAELPPPPPPPLPVADGADVVQIKIRLTDPIQLYLNLWRRRRTAALVAHVAIAIVAGGLYVTMKPKQLTASSSVPAPFRQTVPPPAPSLNEPGPTPEPEETLPSPALGTFAGMKKLLEMCSLWQTNHDPQSVLRGRPLHRYRFATDATDSDSGFDLFTDDDGVVRGASFSLPNPSNADNPKRAIANNKTRAAVIQILSGMSLEEIRASVDLEPWSEGNKLANVLCRDQPGRCLQGIIRPKRVSIELSSYQLLEKRGAPCLEIVILKDGTW